MRLEAKHDGSFEEPMNSEASEPTKPMHFIREIITADMQAGRVLGVVTPLPAGAQWLPAHRARQAHLPRFRKKS
jgi:hypothetical protein